MAKNKLFEVNNILISLKGMVSSIIAGLLLIVPLAITRLFPERAGIAMVLGVVMFILWIFTWGYISNKLWKWK